MSKWYIIGGFQIYPQRRQDKTVGPFKNLKGIVHQFVFYCSNLIFWIVMGCGIKNVTKEYPNIFVSTRGAMGPWLKSMAPRSPAPRVEVPCGYTTPHYYPKYEIWTIEKKLVNNPFKKDQTYEILYHVYINLKPQLDIRVGFMFMSQNA